jgi:hypothetical protein
MWATELEGVQSRALNYACGSIPNVVPRLGDHAVSDGFMAGVQCGNFLHGAAIGLLSAGSGEGMMALGGSLKTGARLAIQVVVGGTISELGGGNFANGAITAAFSFMFDENTHRVRQHTSSYSWHYSISEKASLNKISITY